MNKYYNLYILSFLWYHQEFVIVPLFIIFAVFHAVGDDAIFLIIQAASNCMINHSIINNYTLYMYHIIIYLFIFYLIFYLILFIQIIQIIPSWIGGWRSMDNNILFWYIYNIHHHYFIVDYFRFYYSKLNWILLYIIEINWVNLSWQNWTRCNKTIRIKLTQFKLKSTKLYQLRINKMTYFQS